MNTINLQYDLCFSKDDFLNILKDFLSKQYDDIIYSLHFIIDAAVDKSGAISIVEKECRAGKVIIEYFGDPEDLRDRALQANLAGQRVPEDRADISNNHSHRSCCQCRMPCGYNSHNCDFRHCNCSPHCQSRHSDDSYYCYYKNSVCSIFPKA